MRISVAALLLCACLAHAHICIMSPEQRGGVDISIPGSPACYRRTPYCGGAPPGTPSATYTAGREIEVHLQQNLNHFWPQDPGYLDIAISYEANPSGDSSWIVLDRWDDWAANDMVWQMNFTRRVTLPPLTTCPSCVLRTRYVSHNVDEIDPANNTESIFYNCADISIVKGHAAEDEQAVAPEDVDRQDLDKLSESVTFSANERAADADDGGCCAPDQFTVKAQSSVGAAGDLFTTHTIYFDRKMQYVRWDRVGQFQTLITIANYTAGNTTTIEYLIEPASKTCSIYGSDRFYDWCYGDDRAQSLQGIFSVGPNIVRSFVDFSNGFVFQAMSVNSNQDCIPYTIVQGDFSFELQSYSLSVDSSVFTPPSYCPSPRGLMEEGVTRCGRIA